MNRKEHEIQDEMIDNFRQELIKGFYLRYGEQLIQVLKTEVTQEEEVIKAGLVQLNPEDEHSQIYKDRFLERENRIKKLEEQMQNERDTKDVI